MIIPEMEEECWLSYEVHFEMEVSLEKNSSSRVKGSKNGVAEQGHVINTRESRPVLLNTTLVKWQISLGSWDTICATEQHVTSSR